jgi:histone acetyltransferase
MDNILMQMRNDKEDIDLRKNYSFLFHFLKKNLLQPRIPSLAGDKLGTPPFEKPTIAKAITNFVPYKFHGLPQTELQMMYDLAKMFLYCFNHWKLETPTNHAHSSPTDDQKIYKENYTRWICFCHVPVFCESLQKFEPTLVFGRTLLNSIFLVLRRQLMDRFTAEQDKMLPEKRNLILNHFPRFLNMLEAEIYNSSSPIWREDLTTSGGDVMSASSPLGSSIAPSPSMGPGSVGPSSVGPASVGRGTPALPMLLFLCVYRLSSIT